MTAPLDPEPPKVGMLVLQADESLEHDLRRLLPDDLLCLTSRVPSSPTLTPETLREMEHHLTASAALFPREVAFRAVAYACTSGTAEIGAKRVADLVRAGVETPHVTNPITALTAACAHLGITRLGFVSPYIATVSERIRLVLSDAGITTGPAVNFDEPSEANVARISPDYVADAALQVGQSDTCEAVFLSCTNLRTLDIIEAIETRIDKPALSSNQVLAWHLCRLSGCTPPPSAPGRLFQAI